MFYQVKVRKAAEEMVKTATKETVEETVEEMVKTAVDEMVEGMVKEMTKTAVRWKWRRRQWLRWCRRW